MTRSLLRVAAFTSMMVLTVVTGGCLGGSSEPPTDVVADTDDGPVPPTAFHQTPRTGSFIAWDYESVLFEGLVILNTAGNDFSPFRATWVDLTTGVDLCRADGKQGPSCRINPAGEVSLDYPSEGVPPLETGAHDMVFRIYRADATDSSEGILAEDPFTLYVSQSPDEPDAVYLTWEPSAGTAPISTDTIRLVVDMAEVSDVTGIDALTFDVEWHRDPPLPARRVFQDVPACPSQGEVPTACRLPKDDVCVDDTWWAEVTVHNSQGETGTPVETTPVTVGNITPRCEKQNPEDLSVCTVGVVSGQGVRARYRCSIKCDDADNLSASCAQQEIHYRFEWHQPGVSRTDAIEVDDIVALGESVLQGRAPEDAAQLGTSLAKGPLVCTVYAENESMEDGDTAGVREHQCTAIVQNLQPELGGSCVAGFNEDFPGQFDQNTEYTCEPDLTTLTDPDDDVEDPSLFLYRYEWQRTPLGGNPTPIQIENPELATYPYHCGAPGEESRLARGDTLCCKATPRNPDTNSVAEEGEGHFGEGDECCVTVGNTPPVFRLPPTMQAETLANGTVRATASEETSIRCLVAEGAYFDCDSDRQTDHRFQWSVQLEGSGEFPLFPNGEDLQTTGVVDPSNFNKGDRICCAAVPNDGFDLGLPRRAEACILVENTAPSVTSLRVQPQSAATNEPFTCAATWDDPDPVDNLPGRIEETYYFVITKPNGRTIQVEDANDDGMLNPGEPPEALQQGDRIHCCLTLDDGEDESPRVCSDADFGAPPALVNDGIARIDGVNLVVTGGPDPPTVESTIECRPHGWIDNEDDPEGYRFRWYVNGDLALRDPAGPGAKLRSSIDGTLFAKDDVVTCKVVTFDGTTQSGTFDDAEDPGLIWSASVQIEDACWTVDDVLVSPSEGRNAADQTFRCQTLGFFDPDAADQDNPPTLEYRWFQTQDPRAGLGTPVLGANGIPVATERITGEFLVPNTNDRLVCAVVHTCAGPDAMIPSTNGAQVFNTCPALSGVALEFDNDNPEDAPLVGDLVTCAPQGWDDAEGESPSYRFEWRVNGAPLPEATGETLEVTAAMAHQTMSCGAAPVDSFNDDCTLYLAPSRVVDNTPPEVERVVYDPPEIFTTTDVVCVPDGWIDPDGDRPGYTFEWLVDGAPVSPDMTMTTTYPGDTLSSAAFRKGQRVLGRPTPHDGFEAGPSPSDTQLTVRNTLPSIEVTFAEKTPNPERGENLVCRFDATDPDDDNVTGTFRWYLNDTLQNLTQTADLDDDPSVFELDLTDFEPCDRFRCEVIPNDGEATGLAAEDTAQYWGGAALSLSTPSAVVRPPVADLLPATGTIGWWFRLESSVANEERVLFAHKPAGRTADHVSVVLAADGSPGLRLGTTQIASIATPIPLGHWVYYALQWDQGTWGLFVHIRSADNTAGTWHKVNKSGVTVSAWDPAALHFGAGNVQELAPVGVLDEIRFSSVRRWEPSRVAFQDGLPIDPPRAFWMPLQGDAHTLALYHVTSQGWSEDDSAPLTDWTPGGDTPATYDSATWTRRSQANECQFLVNVPPPAPKVALRIEDIAPLPDPPQNPGYYMRWTVGCDLTEASVDFNGDAVGYVFRLLVEGTEIESQLLSAEEVGAGAAGVTFAETLQFNHTTYGTPCPVVTCSVEAFDGELYSAPGEKQEILGYVKIEDFQDPAVLGESFARLGFGCQLGNICLTNACISDLGGCDFTPKPGPCDDGDACTSGDQCIDGVCLGNDRCEDGNQCTTHTCSIVAGEAVCLYENLSGSCDDGDVCTIGDQCMDGLCVPGYQQNCDDGRVCTQDSCDPDEGCQNLAAPMDGTTCENANLCTVNSTCQGGNCIGGDLVSTDDGNQCTTDGCDPATGVYHSPRVGDPCELVDPCVEGERCRLVGVSVACVGEEKDCNDNNVCTTDGCDSSLPDGCFHLPNNLECNDLNPCTIGDVCSSGSCQPGTERLVCNDGNPCTTDVCEYQVGCRFNYNNDPCNDSNACTENDRCQVGQCVGEAITCDDNNPCTLDYCDSVQGCVYVNTVDACDDGNACTSGDRCADGVCSGTTIDCDDGNPCTTDTCDGNVGCVFTNNNGSCEDGNPCTVNDHCVQGACVSGPGKDCDDDNVCTFDTCSAAGKCEHIAQPGACEDGNLCTLDDQCASGVCVSGALKNCDDEEFCTIDSCDTETGLCEHTNKPANTSCSDGDPCTEGDLCIVPSGQTLMVCTSGAAKDCNDGNVCTLDSCSASGACLHVNQDGATCDDNNACLSNDQCLDGVCAGVDAVNCDDGNPCTTDTCDPAIGCVNTPKTTGTSCSDGNPCTVSDSCQLQSGVLRCVGTTKDCDDNNVCTTDFCGANGVCQHTNLTGTCSDGNACTTGDTCQSGVCTGGPPANCNDANPCTTDGCDPSGDPTDPCTHTPRALNSECSDGEPCTLDDKCVDVGGSLVCQGTVNDCNDNNPCTTDTCQADGTCAYTNKVDGTLCNDENVCTTNDACQGGTCAGTGALSCDDGNSCTLDQCVAPTVGCVNTEQSENSLCNDGSVCTDGDRCKPDAVTGDMECVGTPVSCDDGNPCTQDSCDAVDGCTYVNAPNDTTCDDGNACTVGTKCQAGVCGGGTSTACDDGNQCTTDSCNPDTGACSYVNLANGTSCDDGNPCMIGDRCVSGTCTPVGPGNAGGACDDGNFCTTTDTCQSGTCTGSGSLDCDDGESCTEDLCVPESGCTHSPLTDGATCNDGDACTLSTTCTGGECSGGSLLDCNDGKECTLDSCDPDSGCVNAPRTEGTSCDDGDACTDGDACDAAGNCVPGTETCDICDPVDTFRCDVADDRSIQGSSAALPAEINVYGGTCSTATFGGREATYAITGAEGSDIEVFWTGPTGGPLPSGYSPRILQHDEGCNPNACLADSLGAPVRVQTTAGETYYTVLDHTGTDVGGQYRVHARCVQRSTCVASFGCDGVSRCTMDGMVDQMGNSGNPYATSCTGGTSVYFPGRDRIVQFTAPASGEVMVYLTDGALPPDYFVFVISVGPGGSCDDAQPAGCIASSWIDPETSKSRTSFAFTATGGNVYCLVVDSDNPARVEEFVLSVGCF